MAHHPLLRRLFIEPRRPPGIRGRPDAPWLAVATVCVGAFMGQLDASVVTLALPPLQHEFAVTLGAVEWVALSYLLVLISLVTPVGRIADMVGRKLLYTYGFGVFTIGSLMCALAPNLPVLIGARVLQAVGAAMLQANSVALIVHAVAPRQLSRAIGIQGASQALGLALGPAAGGVLIALGGWRLIFLINLPAGVVGIVLAWLMLPRSQELSPRERFDTVGALLLTGAAGALLLAISTTSLLGRLAAISLIPGAAAVLLGAALVWWEGRVRAPIVNLAIFRDRRFSGGILSGLLAYLVTFGTLFLLPFFLERERHLGAPATGAILATVPLALGVVAPIAGSAGQKVGRHVLTGVGMAAATVALGAIAILQPVGLPLIGSLVLLGAGLGAFTPVNNTSVMSAAPRTASGVAAGLLNMTRGLGTSLGAAIALLVYELSGFSWAVAALAVAALLAAVLSAAPRMRP